MWLVVRGCGELWVTLSPSSRNTLQGRLSLGDMDAEIVVDIDHHAICWLIHLNHVVHSAYVFCC